ncbi:hypothetical protein Bca4012_066845 [Brassica carinata]
MPSHSRVFFNQHCTRLYNKIRTCLGLIQSPVKALQNNVTRKKTLAWAILTLMSFKTLSGIALLMVMNYADNFVKGRHYFSIVVFRWEPTMIANKDLNTSAARKKNGTILAHG